MCSKEIHEEELATLQQCQGGESEDKLTLKLDGEILGGYVDYALIDPVRRLKGKRKGVIIRYDPSLSTPTGPTKPDG